MNNLYKRFGRDLNIINFQVGAPTKAMKERLIKEAMEALNPSTEPKKEEEEPVIEVVDKTITLPEPKTAEVFVEGTDDIKLDEDPSDMKKTELIAYVLTKFGPDADTSGTKAEIIARFFNT